jgi:hypothetical protein
MRRRATSIFGKMPAKAQTRILTYYQPWVPHISLVFREMWGATVGRPFTPWTDTSRSAVEPHISRKRASSINPHLCDAQTSAGKTTIPVRH